MILVADGDLELDAPIGEHLPELDEPVARLTLRQLLSHTAGLAANSPDAAAGMSLRRYVAEHCGREQLILPPGAAFSYSNPGLMLTGRLIEVDHRHDLGRGHRVRPAAAAGHRPGVHPRPGHRGRRDRSPAGRHRALGQRQHRPDPPGRTSHSSRPRCRPAACPPAPWTWSRSALAHLRADGRGTLPAAEAVRDAPAGPRRGALRPGRRLGDRPGATSGAAPPPGSATTATPTAPSCYLRFDADSGCVIALTSNANTGIGTVA